MASDRIASMEAAANREAGGLYDEAARLTPPTRMAARPFGNTENRGAIDRLNGGRRTDTPDENFVVAPKRYDVPLETGQRMLSRSWDELVRVDPTAQNARGVAGVLAQFGKLADEGQLGVADVFQLRRSLTTIQGGMPSADTAAARAAKSSLDKDIEGLVTGDLLRGDAEAAKTWMKAIKGWRDYKQTYGADDVVQRLTERGDDGLLKVKPEDATNFLLTGSNTGWINKRDLASGMGKIRDLLGEKSPEWNALRQEFFIRNWDEAVSQSTPTGMAISGAVGRKAWEKSNRENPVLMRMLYSPEERRDIGNFWNVAARVTTRDGAVYAPSLSAVQLRRLGQFTDKMIGKILPWAGDAIVGLRTAAREGAASRAALGATSGRLPTMGPTAGPLTPLVGSQPQQTDYMRSLRQNP